MRQWLNANGGALAVVIVGVGVAGLTSQTIGLVLICLGGVGLIIQSTPWWKRWRNREAEYARQQVILAGLHREYLASHDGLTPGLLAGTDPLPKDWVEARLKQLGETWRRDLYYPSGFNPSKGPPGVVVQTVRLPGNDRLEIFGTVDGVPYVGYGWESALWNYLPADQDVRDEHGHHLPGYGKTRQATEAETQAYYEHLLREAAGHQTQ